MANAVSAISALGSSSGQGRPTTKNHDGLVIHVGGCVTGTSLPVIVTLIVWVRQLRLRVWRAALTAGSAAWAAGARPHDHRASRMGTPGPGPRSRGLRQA